MRFLGSKYARNAFALPRTPQGELTAYCVDSQKKIIKIVATRCHIFRLKCAKIRFRLGLRPRPRWGAYSAPPDPLAGGEGASRPLPKNPASALGLDFRPLGPQTSAPLAPRCPPPSTTIPPTLGRLEYTLPPERSPSSKFATTPLGVNYIV